MQYSEKEIWRAEEILENFKTPGKVEILSMINNRLLKMQMKEEYIDNPDAQRVIDELQKFLQPVIYKELIRLGDLSQMSYFEYFDVLELRTVEEVERDHRIRVDEQKSTEPEGGVA